MTTHDQGFSKRGMLLLGGLTALVANPSTRQKVLDTLGGVSSSAQSAAQNAYQETVRPLAQEVYEHAQEAAHVALERGGDVASNVASSLRDSGGKQAQALLRAAQPVLSTAQHRLGDVLDGVQERVQDGAAQVRRDGGRVVARGVQQGRRQGLKVQQELARELSVRGKRMEKVSGRKLRAAEKQMAQELARAERRLARHQPRQGGGGGLLALGLLVAGGVVLARVPAARQAILRAVGSVNPEAAESLHRAGTNVRNIVGTVWMERIEPETATAAPAPKTSQATGSAAYATVEPGSPAQALPPRLAEEKGADKKPDEAAKPAETKPAEAAKTDDKGQASAKN